MKKLLIIFILVLCGCQSKVVTEDEKIKIIVATDMHYYLKEYYEECDWYEDYVAMGDGKMITYGDQIMDDFIHSVIKEKPDLLLITGDITLNGEYGSHQEMAKRLSVLNDYGIEVAVMPGNHDIDNIFTKGYGKENNFKVENTSVEQFRNLYKNLGYHLSTSTHTESLSYEIQINSQYSLLLIDSNTHTLTSGSALDNGGKISESTYEWIEERLSVIQKEGRIPLVSLHHNITDHNELLNSSYTLRDNQRFVDLLNQYGVKFTLTGHIHAQNIKQIDGIYDIVTSSLVVAPLQYGVLEIDSGNVNYYTQQIETDIESNDYFLMVSSNRFEESFEAITDEDVREKMKDVVVKTKLYYVGGTLADHKDEIMSMEGYPYFVLEEGEKLGFYVSYLNSMLSETLNHNALSFSLYQSK